MPTLYKLLGYTIYFWSGDGAEPVHVHVGKGRPNENDTKIYNETVNNYDKNQTVINESNKDNK